MNLRELISALQGFADSQPELLDREVQLEPGLTDGDQINGCAPIRAAAVIMDNWLPGNTGSLMIMRDHGGAVAVQIDREQWLKKALP
jgi:hypothetical protein